MRILLATLLGAIALAVATAPADAAVSLSATGDARFPEREYVLTLPEHSRLADGQVQVSENGKPVRGLRVAPVGADRRAKLGVVLAIDASSSMRGRAFEEAFDAARAFARERNGRQPFALVTFGSGSRVALPFTNDEGQIHDAMHNPGTPSGGTHMYDAALRSVELVRDSGLPGGFVVVLSDGTDHGSTADSDEVLAAARRANVRVYTVGLRSDRFDPEALGRLAEGGGGDYSEAGTPAELREIYRALGAQLSNAYTVAYRSLAGPRRRVEVRATVAGLGAATATYRSPSLGVGGPAGGDTDGWGSPLAVVVAILVVVGLAGLALLLVLRSRLQTPRERVAQFVRLPGEETDKAQSLTGRLAAGAERSLSKAGWWEGFATDVDVADIRYSPGQLVVGAAVVALSLGLLAASAAGSAALFLVPVAIAPPLVWGIVHWRAERQRRLFGEQLADHLSVVGGSLRVGHSFPAALAAALDEAPEPARGEFARAMADERLGRPLEDALESVARRMNNREVEHVALLAKLQREAGSDAAEMVDQVVTTVRERQELRRTVRTLTAQGRLSQWILSLLPVGSLLFLTVTARELCRSALQHLDRPHRPRDRRRSSGRRLTRDPSDRVRRSLRRLRMLLLLILALALGGVGLALAARAAVMPRIRAEQRIARIAAYGYPAGRRAPTPERVAVLPRLGALVGNALLPTTSRQRQADLRKLILAAGAWNTTPATVLGYRALAAGVSGGLVLWMGLSGGWSPFVLIVGAGYVGIMGWIAPLFLLKARARRRTERVELELPELLDLLVVTLEAGVGFISALQRSAERMTGPLADEIRLTLREHQLGLEHGRGAREPARPLRHSRRASLRPRGGPERGARNLDRPGHARPGGGHAPPAAPDHRGEGPEGADQDALPARLPDPARASSWSSSTRVSTGICQALGGS